MKDSETEKPEYIYRPSIFFHAADDTEAKSRVSQLRAMIEGAVQEDTHIEDFTYDQVWHESDSLAKEEGGTA